MRGGWLVVSGDFCVEILGCRFRFTGDTPELLGILAELLEPSRCPNTAIDHVITVSSTDSSHSFLVNDFPGGEAPVGRSVSWALWIVSQVAQDVERPTFLVHGACAQVAGAHTIVIGRSGAGKSTLTAGLMAAGAMVLTDELTEFAAGARVVDGYRRAVMLESDALSVLESADLLRQLDVVPLPGVDGAAVLVSAEQRLRPISGGVRTTVVVLGDRHAPFGVRRLRPAEIAVALIEHSVGPETDRHILLQLVASIAEGCDGVEISGGNLTQRVNLVMNPYES